MVALCRAAGSAKGISADLSALPAHILPRVGFDRSQMFNNDVSVLKLSSDVDFDAHPNIRPVCFAEAVPQEGDMVNERVTVGLAI